MRCQSAGPPARIAALAACLLALTAANSCGGDEDDSPAEAPLNETFESPANSPATYNGIELAGDLQRVFITADSDSPGAAEIESTLDCERSGERVQSHHGAESPRTPLVRKIDLKGRPGLEGTSDCELSGSARLQNGDPDARLTVTVTEVP